MQEHGKVGSIMKKTNTWKDVATDMVSAMWGVVEGKYFINEDGKVRTASKKPKKTVLDTRGNEMVVLDTNSGGQVAIYIADLLTAVHGAENQDMFNERKLAAAQSGSTRRTSKRPHLVIKEGPEDLVGGEFKSFAAAARDLQIGYDKFYNTFYTKGLKEAKFVYPNGTEVTVAIKEDPALETNNNDAE